MAISFENHVNAFSTTAANPAVVNLAATNHTAGNLLVAVLLTQASGTISISDTAGNTYVQAGATVSNNPNRLAIYYAQNCLGNANNVVQLSTVNAGGDSYHAFGVLQFSGIETSSSALADNDGDTGNSTTASTPSLTLARAEGVIVTLAEADNLGQSNGPGYTMTFINDALGNFTTYQFKIVTASEAPTMTCNSAPWRMKSALFHIQEGVAPTVVLLGQGVM